MTIIEQGDGAGCEVWLESANKAVAALSELWGHALFDCGPQDWEFMRDEILAAMAGSADRRERGAETFKLDWFTLKEIAEKATALSNTKDMRLRESLNLLAHYAIVAAHCIGRTPRAEAGVEKAPREYGFDRFRNGRKMAEGVRVHACSLDEAEQEAKALFTPWDARDVLRIRVEEAPAKEKP